MVKLEKISDHIVIDTETQSMSRSSIIGGISLGKYSIAIESGSTLEIGMDLKLKLRDFFNLPVKYLFLTHTHNDHRGGMDAFSDETLIMSEKCKENMPKRIRLSKFSLEAFEEKHIIQENELSMEFLKVAGHSIGSSVAYFPSEKVLFAGDLFITEPINFGLPFMSFYQNKPKRTGNPEEYFAAFELFKSMDIDVIVPGHGQIINNPQEYLDKQTAFFNGLKTHFVAEIKRGNNLEEIEMPSMELIVHAYKITESRKPKSKHVRFLDHYLEVLKTSFYNYYSGIFHNLD
ncbi:MAG: MBL fold metallo-hydrolase [Candidatus Heimdallarchaeota archaeon]